MLERSGYDQDRDPDDSLVTFYYLIEKNPIKIESVSLPFSSLVLLQFDGHLEVVLHEPKDATKANPERGGIFEHFVGYISQLGLEVSVV